MSITSRAFDRKPPNLEVDSEVLEYLVYCMKENYFPLGVRDALQIYYLRRISKTLDEMRVDGDQGQ